MRHSMGCNCTCIVNVFSLVSFYFPQRFTLWDKTNWAASHDIVFTMILLVMLNDKFIRK